MDDLLYSLEKDLDEAKVLLSDGSGIICRGQILFRNVLKKALLPKYGRRAFFKQLLSQETGFR
jgi:hypothetical protein